MSLQIEWKMTVPNALSFFRILLVPVFCFERILFVLTLDRKKMKERILGLS